MTEWNLFRSLEFDKLKAVMRRPVLLDLRNVYDPEGVTAAGFTYISVGRRAYHPTNS
jgi:UDPglucose 6-dehydrogenase